MKPNLYQTTRVVGITALMALLFVCQFAQAQKTHYTRGIGLYPGKVKEFVGPQCVKNNTYHNLALMHTTMASVNADENLTAQLVTDGIITHSIPPAVKVTVNDSVLTLRNKYKCFDANIHSDNVLSGENSYIQYEWRGMKVKTGSLKLNAVAVYHPEKINGSWLIRVLALNNANQWHEIGKVQGDTLPGIPATFKMSSDPNKQWAVDKLPLRQVNMELPLIPGNYSGLRIEVTMKGCAYWRFYETMFTSDETSMLPSYAFASAWASPEISLNASEQQWIMTDFGAQSSFDKIVLHWIERPLQGCVQSSVDGSVWTNIAVLSARNGNTDTIRCNAKGKYVRVLMDKVNSSRQYILSEMEVWGKGGMSPTTTKGTNIDVLAPGRVIMLDANWELCRKGDNHWIPATVPGTVLTSYINVGAVPENTYANNMRQISESYFNADFTYRTNLFITRKPLNRLWLNFEGINWKSVVKINGSTVGTTAGAFMRGRFDITPYLTIGKNLVEVEVIHNAHVGAVKVKNHVSTDLNGGVLGADNPTFQASVGWDWITSTPGRNVGIWGKVFLAADKGVHVDDPFITTKLHLPDTLATITPSVKVVNNTLVTVKKRVKGWIGKLYFEKTVQLFPGETKEVLFLPSEFPQLSKQKLKLWWPNGYGTPWLYDAGFAVEGDTVRYKAGIRQIDYKDLNTDAKIYINGKRFIPLGGNWGFSEINLRYRDREYDVAMRYHRDMNFTMVRNWVGQIGDRAFFETCDRYGIMVWQDFWLANPWDGPDPNDETMFMQNANDLIQKIRRHPSVALYVGRNEGFPPKSLDVQLRKSVEKFHPSLGYISSSADNGVSGHGPYRIMPTNSWYFVHQSGKLHSERGIPNVPSMESMSRMLPNQQLWPMGDAWGEHDFTLEGAPNVLTFQQMLNTMFGSAKNIKEFTQWAQWINFDAHRAMFESEALQRKGLLMWMSHPCWPSTVWQTYDYYLEPTAGYFAIKKACEPLHIFYNGATDSVLVRNISRGSHKLMAVVECYDMWGKLMKTKYYPLVIHNDETKFVEKNVWKSASGEVGFLRLKLMENGRTLSENTYVLAAQENDFKALKVLGLANVEKHVRWWKKGNRWFASVKLRNKSQIPALMVRLNLKGNDNEQILPVIYSDNYFHLMPDETKTIMLDWQDEDTRGCEPQVELSGFNLP